MTREQLIAFATGWMPEIKLGINKQFPEFILTADKIRTIAQLLKENPETKMDYLFCLTASDRKDGLNVIYHLTSSVHGHSVMLRVILPDKTNSFIPTVIDLWKAAEYYEREVFDLFGIRFENHPDLRRIFLEEDWIGFPLRKDYKDTFTLDR
jgi:NADH-quinone oxidoreductase subunit C